MIQHSSLEGVRHVKLSQTKSAFWRFHTKGVSEDGVCTIEAMYFFLEGLKGRLADPQFEPPHCFDNLVSQPICTGPDGLSLTTEESL